MDRSDPHLQAAVDPTTQKTQPTKPEPEAWRGVALSWVQGHPRPLLKHWDRAQIKAIGVRAAKVAAIVFAGWFTVVLFLIAVYRFVNPPFSSLMVLKWLGGTSIQRQWVPLERISPNLMRAVIASEDGRFCSHWGIDFGEVAAAIRRSSGGTPRGASTITMQVAKNLFLWPAKSYVRKLVEVPLTYAIELMWPKRRILEVYLNIAQWGPGIFGAEAAAREHFNRSASRLNARQAAQLAVTLPNPVARDAGAPGPWTSRRATVIQRRAARSPEAASCVLGGE
jgi:monofunctional biosynthetic peptidoglycan transglycosylase